MGRMFNMGLAELVIVLLIAFLVVGPKDLPKVARAIARFVKYLKQLFAEFQEETGLDDVMKDLKETGGEIKETLQEADMTKDLNDAKREFDRTLQQMKQNINKPLE
ncbi:MAG: twin-arginine translocase TatA/TatE family subunit [Clostridia bacterium]|nr:twin-arginine translocase TatA/TatE family subunit [Clostridia bacterium]